jgi:predicted small lipoprotein YifL
MLDGHRHPDRTRHDAEHDMTRTTNRPLILAAALLAGACILAAGCGRKGPLYMPDEGSPAAASAPAAEQPSAQDGDEKK